MELYDWCNLYKGWCVMVKKHTTKCSGDCSSCKSHEFVDPRK